MQTAGNEDYLPLDPEQLYCVATDSYILSYLPMAGEMLPMLKIVPKDSTGGNPVENLDDLIVYSEDGGEQLKVWQTVVEYALMQPVANPDFPKFHPATGHLWDG